MPTVREAFTNAVRVGRGNRLRPNTIRALLETQKQFEETFGADAALPVDLSEFKAAMARYAPSTVNRHLRCYKRVCRLSKVQAEITMLRVPKKRPDTLSETEITRLLNAAGRLHPIILFAVDTGARRSEIVGLRWENVDIQRRRCVIADAKDGSERLVPLSKRLIETLKLLPKGEFVFRKTRHKDQPFHVNAISNAINEVFKKAGLSKNRRGLHSLRRSFCTRASNAGVPIATTMAISGHRQVSTMLNYYVSVSDESMVDAVDKLARDDS